MPTPSPDQVARFRDETVRLLGGVARLGLAVSGGPDSLAMLLLGAAAFPGSVEAATVDHRLRPESGEEAEAVRAACERLGTPHSVLAVDVPDQGAGLQGDARGVRYAALAGWARERGLAAVATAHHADDQAETLLMRLKRGSGISGLSGIRRINRLGDMVVIRPLLDWTRAELGEIVSASGLEAADDPSNRDVRFDRAALRAFLADRPDYDARRLARSAAALGEAEEAIEWAAERLAAERVSREAGDWRIDPKGLPRELRRRLLWRTLSALRHEHGIAPEWTGGEDVEPLLRALESGSTATLAGVLASGGNVWRLRPAPPRRTRG